MSLTSHIFSAYQQSYERMYDTVHFSSNSSPQSWAGHVNEEEDMPEDTVREYISSNNPKLFQKLHGLPLSSSDIPMSFHGQRTLYRLGRNGAGPGAGLRFQQQHYAPLVKLPVQATLTPVRNVSTAGQTIRSHAEALTVKAKERIEHKLANGYVLDQRQLSPADAPLPCDFTLCIGELLNFTKLQYYVVEYDHASSTSSKAPVSNTTEYYCNGCFDTIYTIGEQENILPAVSNAPGRLLLGGIHHEHVMHAAARLYPDIRPRAYPATSFTDKRGRPDQAFNWPSNSPENHARRSYKQHETGKTLAEVAKYEKAILDERVERDDRLTREPSPDVSVLITRPAYLEPREDRYKKQGLTRHDWHKYSKEKRRSEPHGDTRPDTPLASPIKLPDQLQENFCYCRGGDDGTEMLKCSSELCPVGWSHLSCTDLKRLPTIHEQFYCYYCSDASATRSMLTENRSSSTEPTTPLSAGLMLKNIDETFDNGWDAEQEEKDAEDVDDDVHSTFEGNLSNQVGIKWPAVNSSHSTHATTCLTGLSNGDAGLSLTGLSEADLGEEQNLRGSQASGNHKTSAITSSPLATVETSSPASPSTSDLTLGHNQTSRTMTEAPVTPPLQPVRPMTKPWGTPINLDKLDIFDPLSPSPNRKRKRDSTREHFEDGIRVDCEIPDSDDEGEEVPLILDLQVLQDCNR